MLFWPFFRYWAIQFFGAKDCSDVGSVWHTGGGNGRPQRARCPARFSAGCWEWGHQHHYTNIIFMIFMGPWKIEIYWDADIIWDLFINEELRMAHTWNHLHPTRERNTRPDRLYGANPGWTLRSLHLGGVRKPSTVVNLDLPLHGLPGQGLSRREP